MVCDTVATEAVDTLHLSLLPQVAPSVPTSTVPAMESDDIVDPGDAAIQALAALTAEHTRDEEKRDMLMDFILTAPPLAEWPPNWREILLETCRFIQHLGRDLRRQTEADGDVGE